MDRSYDSLRHQEMFWADFKDVSELEILLEGNTYTITSDKKEDERRFTAIRMKNWIWQTFEVP